MARPSVDGDVFLAIAEPRRRDLLVLLAEAGAEGAPVNDLVAALDIPQPTVSKHLAVLRSVGVVAVARRGRQRVYRLEAERLRPVHEWIRGFEKHWDQQLLRIKERAERRAAEQRAGRGERGA